MKIEKIWFYMPRVLAILFIIFMSVFAFEAFLVEEGIWNVFSGLLINLFPVFVVMIVLIFAWEKEKAGGILFILLGLYYVVIFGLEQELIVLSFISGPLIFIGILFILKSIRKD